MTRWSWAVVAGVLCMAGRLWAVDPHAPGFREMERVAAVVNDDIILLSEVDEQLVPMLSTLSASVQGAARSKRIAEMRRDILDGLVADRLLQQEVESLHVEATPEDVDRAVREVQRQNGLDDPGLKQALAQQGLSMNEYRDTLRKQLLKAKIINLKVRSRLSVSEEDLQSSVARRARLRTPEFRVRARHALFTLGAGASAAEESEQKSRADAFFARARRGEDFEALVRELSDPPARDSGGDLGFFKRGQFVAEFEKAAFGTLPGQVAAPVRTPLGWHVIQVVERKSADERTPDQVERDLREQLLAEEMERAFKRYVSELRSSAHVEVRLE